jgi:hypothetical protein
MIDEMNVVTQTDDAEAPLAASGWQVFGGWPRPPEAYAMLTAEMEGALLH